MANPVKTTRVTDYTLRNKQDRSSFNPIYGSNTVEVKPKAHHSRYTGKLTQKQQEVQNGSLTTEKENSEMRWTSQDGSFKSAFEYENMRAVKSLLKTPKSSGNKFSTKFSVQNSSSQKQSKSSQRYKAYDINQVRSEKAICKLLNLIKYSCQKVFGKKLKTKIIDNTQISLQ